MIIGLPDGSEVAKPMVGKYFWAISDHLLGQLLSNSRDPFSREYLILIAQTTALEAMLNDEIIVASLTVFGKMYHKPHAEALLRASTRDKLTLLPPLLTHNEFVLNRGSKEVGQLFAMVSRRNKIIHTVSEFEPYAPDIKPATLKGKRKGIPSKGGPAPFTVTVAELQENSRALAAFFEDVVISVAESRVQPNRFLRRKR
jgi:hypothetical protein